MEQEFNFNQLKMELYGDRVYVTQKWISNFGLLNQYADFGTYINCIKEAFNMVEIVMGNTIYNYRQRFTSTERVSLGRRNGRERFGYRYEGVEEVIDYSMASTFFGKAKILRAIHFSIPENLDDVRVLRNMTTHNTHTMVGTVADQVLSYEQVLKSMEILGQTLNMLGLLRAEDILPEYEKMRVEPGDHVGYSGEYEVQEFIAEGGMSRVYRGLQTRLDRQVAIKELKPYTYRPDQIQNEKQFLVSLEHSQIPQIFDVFSQNGTYYIVMEYIDGRGLDRYVEETDPDMDERLAIAIQICKVLRYIHDGCEMVYADLKPENVMIERSGRVCLIDFGISQLAEGDITAGAYSWFYSSPEQMEGKAMDRRSDIYSLGSILQYLFAYNNDNGGISYSEELGDYREEMKNLCEICKREDPEGRFGTVDEVENHLRRIKTLVALQPNLRKKRLRRTILGTVAGLLTLLITGALVAYNILFPTGNTQMIPDSYQAFETEEGIVISFSCVNRKDSSFGGKNGSFRVVMKPSFELIDSRSKDKSVPYYIEFDLKNVEVGPGEYLKDQKCLITWEELRKALESAGCEIVTNIDASSFDQLDVVDNEGHFVYVFPHE